jgi:glycosyltransferase involved in cell wall biosynthesis
MRYLFLHPNFPAQFRHILTALAQDPTNQVVFGTARQDGAMPGVTKIIYQPSRKPHPETHHYVKSLEGAVIEGQAVYRTFQPIKEQGFYPDIIFAHSGWGPALFMKDIFPRAQLCCYFEWFYHAHGSDADFDPSDPLNADDEARIRIKNAPILLDWATCDRGLTPTKWQQYQFPLEARSKLTVMHDGVDTTYFQPQPNAKLVIPNLDLSAVDEIITYVARGMEPYRGFPQFMETLALVQKRRPNCHAVIVGAERVAYGKQLPPGQSHKQLMLEKLSLDLSRIHFTGLLPYDQYRQVLQASRVHVYLTRPFVLSWSMLEAMSTGCLVLGSATQPVQELIQDGENGLLVDFFSPEKIANRIDEALDNADAMQPLRARARETILANYDLAQLLPKQLAWMHGK